VGFATSDLVRSGERQRSPRRVMTQRTDELSDEQLMALLDESPQQQLDAALSTLYNRYSRTVYGVGLKILSERSLAEELVQEVFLKVWRSAGSFDPSRGSFSTWLYRVTRSCATDLYRKRARRGVRSVVDADEYIAASVADTSAGPQEVVDDSWLSWRVSRALEALDVRQREVIELAYFGDLTQREISERTGLALGTVKSRTASAFRKLREELVLHDTALESMG
jgi:RNA polymerase sigma-70 factor, ECF subfamily